MYKVKFKIFFTFLLRHISTLLIVGSVSVVCCVVCSERRENSFTLQWYCHWQWHDCDYNYYISYSSRLY